MDENYQISQMQNLVSTLNEYRDAYYNRQESLVSDEHYDQLSDHPVKLEEKTGIIISGSPTQSVGYEVKSELIRVAHNHPMLSLDKTKSVEDLVSFLNNKIGVMMLKLDGLTISLRYVNGDLVSAETRGNGSVGEDILHNAKVFDNIPLHINHDGELIVDGEAIITYEDFEAINSKLSEDQQYKNPRNLASGSVRQLDSKVAASRHIKFIAWKMITGGSTNSFRDDLVTLGHYGFEVTPFLSVYADKSVLDQAIESLKDKAKALNYPIDGMVLGYDDIEYGRSLGMTSHHLRSQIAFKFYDEEVESKLRDIEWTMGKTGQLTPTAVFNPVEIDGTTVERASLHNVSIMTELLGSHPYVGQKIWIYKANQIIPQISRAELNVNEDINLMMSVPKTCPICNGTTEVCMENNTSTLYCSNPNCSGKLLGKLNHFVSKHAMDIKGLSEATLECFISLGWLNSFLDIYRLHEHKAEMMKLDGFGKSSVNKLLTSIEDSRTTTLAQYISALSIPLIGRTASKAISNYVHGDIEKFLNLARSGDMDWTVLDGFGIEMHLSLSDYVSENYEMMEDLSHKLGFKVENESKGNSLAGYTFVITGSLNRFSNRDELKKIIESHGGKVAGSVSAKTSFLINNDTQSSSSKNQKAKSLGVKIISEDEFLALI